MAYFNNLVFKASKVALITQYHGGGVIYHSHILLEPARYCGGQPIGVEYAPQITPNK